MERYEKAMERKAQAEQNQRVSKRPIVSTIDDIKRVIAVFDPENRLNKPTSSAVVSAQLTGTLNEQTQARFNVSASTNTKTERDVIMEGIDIIRKRRLLAEQVKEKQEAQPMIINGRDMKSAKIISTEGKLAVDPIIDRVTAGHRVGEHICWDLADGYTYKYDIFQHKLTRFKREEC